MGDLDGLGTAEQAWTGAEVDSLFAALDTEGLGRYGLREKRLRWQERSAFSSAGTCEMRKRASGATLAASHMTRRRSLSRASAEYIKGQSSPSLAPYYKTLGSCVTTNASGDVLAWKWKGATTPAKAIALFKQGSSLRR